MAGGIYLIQNDNNVIEMKQQTYDSEEVLQRLLVEHDYLLGGDQIDPSSPRRWLLISREAPVPSEEDGPGRWAVDHVFLDQDGVPTLVEVKRSSNSEIRRKVVGQMLDYAANAQVYWPVDRIQEWLTKTCELKGRDSGEALRELVGKDVDEQAFWKTVETNLQAGRVRLLFVADVIPPELRRVVEFLNEQMNPAEVLAVEIPQFVGQNSKALVPRVIGRSPVHEHPATKWTWDRFSSKLRESSREDVSVAKCLLDWGTKDNRFVYWGMGKATGFFVPQIKYAGKYYQFFQVATSGYLSIPFGAMKGKVPFDSPESREKLLARINELLTEKIHQDQIDRFPSFKLAELREGNQLDRFLEIYDWFIKQVKDASGHARGAVQSAS